MASRGQREREKTKRANDRHLRHPISNFLLHCVCVHMCVCPAFCTEVITLTGDLEGPAEFRQGSITPFTHTHAHRIQQACIICIKQPVCFASDAQVQTHSYCTAPAMKTDPSTMIPAQDLSRRKYELWAVPRDEGKRTREARSLTLPGQDLCSNTISCLFFSLSPPSFVFLCFYFPFLSLLEIKSSWLHWTHSYPLCAEKCHFLCFIILFPPLWEAGRKVCFEERWFNICTNK